MSQNQAREAVFQYLNSQILGPDVPSRAPTMSIDLDSGETFIKKSDRNDKALYDSATGWALLRENPKLVFGTGVLHPPQEERISAEEIDEDPDSTALATWGSSNDTSVLSRPVPDEDDSGLEKSQTRRPTVFGLSARSRISEDSKVRITLSAGVYEQVDVKIEDSTRETDKWWRRKGLSSSVLISGAEILEINGLRKWSLDGELGRYVNITVSVRNSAENVDDGKSLMMTIVAQHLGNSGADELFQTVLTVDIEEQGEFVPLAGPGIRSSHDEDAELEYHYRHIHQYARGHGSSANWTLKDGTVKHVYTEWLPISYQEVIETQRESLNLSMDVLSNGSESEVFSILEALIDQYSEWISQHGPDVNASDWELEARASSEAKCRNIEQRMRRGLALLRDNPEALEAFRLANESMLLQQERSKRPKRRFEDKANVPVTFEKPVALAPEKYGRWFPFQLGFLLMSLEGIVEPLSEDRESVDLIFFPTGGGKTEAYLGLSAFTIWLTRLREPNSAGLEVLMRYTLRLLTSQQFERSASLLVAMEAQRRKNPNRFGKAEFSIGIWVGAETTPNTRKKALGELTDSKSDGMNKFILRKCPWCAAEFGIRKSNNSWIGFSKSVTRPPTMIFRCGDRACEFSGDLGLPIKIVDEDIYSSPPTFLVATVDKFAQVAWKRESRVLFGIDEGGNKTLAAPKLILQDELHLISGPLGSMFGLYETVFQSLWSRDTDGGKVVPKLVASTATAKRAHVQLSSLFGREKATIFPQAIDRVNETFFSRVKKEAGHPEKGTMYVGVNPATFATGQQSLAQIAAFLSQASANWDGSDEQIDYYSTSLWFFSSLKELGQSLTLMQTSTESQLTNMWRTGRLPFGKQKYLRPIRELTSRLPSGQLTEVLEMLQSPQGSPGFVATCLASSIMEVGVDVGRLGLLTIMGQPKQTSQYIQVAGRVGRERGRGPGLVVMLYNTGRARDRNTYEFFHQKHGRLYAQVEPLSATPFSPAVLRKGFYGALLSHYRTTSPADAPAATPDINRLNASFQIIKERVSKASPASLNSLENSYKSFVSLWGTYQPLLWNYPMEVEDGAESNETALIRGSLEQLENVYQDMSVFVPRSMRDVDKETKVRISSNPYTFAVGEDNE